MKNAGWLLFLVAIFNMLLSMQAEANVVYISEQPQLNNDIAHQASIEAYVSPWSQVPDTDAKDLESEKGETELDSEEAKEDANSADVLPQTSPKKYLYPFSTHLPDGAYSVQITKTANQSVLHGLYLLFHALVFYE